MYRRNTPDVSGEIRRAKQDVAMAVSQLLKTFDFVPDDKLDWKPSESARSALRIVAHCAASNEAFLAVLKGGEMELAASPEEASAQIREGGSEIQTREEAIRRVEESSAAILNALDKVTAKMLATSPNSPFGPFPFALWMILPARHMDGHARQIDYLQTIWGDLDDHA